jgi:hypothetical protein
MNDFDTYSWHDNHVHALRIRSGEHGTGELVLDLDYILEWLPPRDGAFTFRVAPATLTFHGVVDLRVSLDYAGPSAGMTPFSIQGIDRELYLYGNGFSAFRWRIPVNWPDGEITFIASGFTQVLRAPPVDVADPCLTSDARAPEPRGA